MSYQYQFCPTCGVRRIGHAQRCTVCDGLLPRPEPRRASSLAGFKKVASLRESYQERAPERVAA
jgi:hypothetical protein